MGAFSRSKGRRAEQEVVLLARQHGLEASREWQNAQSADPTVRRCDCLIGNKRAQVKVAADGYSKLYAGLQDVELLFVRSDRQPWLCVLRAEKFLELLKGNKEKAGHHRLETTLAWLKARRASRDNGRHQS
jgi:hypothetical protein